MKKLLLALCILSMGITTMTFTATAQASKEYQKQQKQDRKTAEKIAKQQAKVLKKGKWEYTGAVPLEMALTNYYLETLEECGGTNKGIEHEVSNMVSLSGAEKKLLLDAQANYAQEIQAMVGAKIAEDSRIEAGNEMDVVLSNVAAQAKHEFNGDVRRAILLKKHDPNGKTWTVRAYYIIDETSASRRADKIADEISKNTKMIDSIHEEVFKEK